MLNEKQLRAIESESDDILVSASAGTGKTTVLVKRIIKCIETRDLDMSRLIAVTFSRAAADELREKIRRGIAEEAERLSGETGTDGNSERYLRRLRRQQDRVGLATVSTIHSLCKKLTDEYFDRLGVPPRLRIFDEAENSVMKKSLAGRVDEMYQLGIYGELDMEGLAAFEDALSPGGENPDRHVSCLYDMIRRSAKGMKGFGDSVGLYRLAAEKGFESTPWFEEIKRGVRRDLGFWEGLFDAACARCAGLGLDRHGEVFGADLRFVKKASEYAENGDFKGLRALTEDFTKNGRKRLPGAEKSDDPEFEFCRRTRMDGWAGFLKKLVANLPDVSRHNALAEGCLETARAGSSFMERFNALYAGEKLRRGLADFDDLEEMAYRLLWDEETGGPTQTARDFAARTDAIFIDEYQDVNRRQDRIFSALRMAHGSDGRPARFMVGDFKQSIYGFRGSDPGIFAEYLRNPPEGMEIIHLNVNYRCDRSVINCVNRVAGGLFRLPGLDMPYTEEDDLVAGKPEDGDRRIAVQTRFPADPGDGEDLPARERMAEAVAACVRELIDEGERPEDICILMRDDAGRFGIYKKALEKLGIDGSDGGQDLLSAPEVVFTVCLLTAVDNPSDDIALAGTLKSPVFGFTLQDLADVRRAGGDRTLYEALKAYTEETGSEKGARFLAKFGNWRSMISLPVDRLLWYIYCDTGVMAYAGAGKRAGEKKRRLLSLHRMAAEYADSAGKGLDGFIARIRDVIEESGRLREEQGREKGSVAIMSMHRSKGLEFGTVIIAETGTRLKYGEDGERDYGYTDGEGFVFKIEDGEYAGVSTIPCLAADRGGELKGAGEEIRLLYVALTRAKNRLIIFREKPDDGTCAAAGRYLKGQALTDYVVKAKNHAAWLAMYGEEPAVQESARICSETYENAAADPRLAEEIRRRLAFRYDSGRERLPAKLSVSRLRPDVLDEYDLSKDLSETVYAPRDPDFLSGTPLSGADVGTATHMFMQFCDFKALRSKGARSELGRLIGERFIAPESAGLVRLYEADRFGKSRICSRILASPFVKRELRFNVALDAENFSSDPASAERLRGEKLLVQGVIDCLYEDQDGTLTVLDYKTDYMPAAFRGREEEFGDLLRERHRDQLNYYGAAAEIITGRPVGRRLIWSFAAGRAFEL